MTTSAERLELDGIRADQGRLRELVTQLDRRIDALSRRVESPAFAPAVSPPPPEVPPSPGLAPAPLAPPPGEQPPPLPRPAPPAPQAAAEPAIRPATPPPAATNPGPDESLELRVGTYWMSRIGIVILLTGLVFLGNYAYHRIVPLLGAWGKLSLLALAGAVLGGLGVWLERSRESTRNFGRVLLSGGAATIYYTAYAAHFVDALRVITSPLLGGGMLLVLTGAFVVFADRRRSEAVAVPALLLAYYTSAINPVGTFTLFSNFLLASVAVLFLIRHEWTRLSLVSLLATYGSYVFWRWQHAGGPTADLGVALTFLALYWALFTAATFASSRAAMNAASRVAFLTLNNGAFFAFAALHFQTQRPGSFWLFSIAFGGMLLALSALAARWRHGERALDGAYLAQGLAMVTLGLAAKLTGPQLAVVLAVESVVLLTPLRRRHGVLYEIAAALCALGSCALTLDVLHRGLVPPAAVAGPVATLLLFAAWWVKRLRAEGASFSARALGFALLGWFTFAALLWKVVPMPWQSAAFAMTAAVSILALRVRLPELMWTGQAFLIGGLLLFVTRFIAAAPAPWWLPAPLVIVAIGLMHWWLSQREVAIAEEVRTLPPLTAAGIAVVAGCVWMSGFYRGEQWLLATSATALGTLLYGWLTRGWPLALVGQVFTVLSVGAFLEGLGAGQHGRWFALAPVANVAITAAIGRWVVGERAGTIAWIGHADLVRIYRLAAAAMLAAWAFVYVPAEWRVAFYAMCGVIQMLGGAALANSERRALGAIYGAVALAFFWMRFDAPVAVIDLLAILAVPGSVRVARRMCGETPVLPFGRDALVGAAVATVWLWSTRWMLQSGHGAQLTAGWAVLALVIFAAGLGLRERMYRLAGFAVLALALGRLFIFDVWRFDTLPRIVSFLVLGGVLLVLSFVYHRFTEVLRRWL